SWVAGPAGWQPGACHCRLRSPYYCRYFGRRVDVCLCSMEYDHRPKYAVSITQTLIFTHPAFGYDFPRNLRFGTYSGTSNHRYGCLGTAVKLLTGYHGRFGVADGVYHGAHRNHGCTVRTSDGRTASTRHDAHRVVSKTIFRHLPPNSDERCPADCTFC